MIDQKQIQKVSLLVILLSTFIQTNAQNTLTLAANLIQSGDSVAKEQIEYVYAGDDGVNAVWDFSNLGTDDVYYIKYDTITKAQIAGYDMQKTYKYQIVNDSLFMTGYESSLISVDYKVPLLILSFPLQLNQTSSASYQGEGR